MTTSSPPNASLTGWRTDPPARTRVQNLILYARGVIAAERFVPALWPALGFAALYLSLALLGLFTVIPWPVQALLLAATITAIGLALAFGFEGLSLPRWQDGARRLEKDSGLKHRPISESDDRLIGSDPFALALWRLHQARGLPQALRVNAPAIAMAARDPKSLRYFALVLLAVSLVVARGDWLNRLTRAFDSGAGLNLSVDAWVDPPAYTGLPPVYLAHDGSAVSVPAGSNLNVRVHGGDHAPGLSLGGGTRPRFRGGPDDYAATARIARDSHVRVRASGHVIGNWQVHAIPDAVPEIRFTAKPIATEHQATQFSFHASDDYGVTGVRVVIRPHGKYGKALNVDLPLAQASKSFDQTTYSDLTAHPYAGLTVDAVLEARDGAGQTGRSTAMTFTLPAPVFTDPLARALIEQRRILATADRDGRRRVAIALDALAIAPDKFYDGKNGIYLAVRAAYWGVRSARSDSDIDHVEKLLWDTAIALDHGALLQAAEELRRLKALLDQALASHAPQDVVDALLRKYNDAMQRYMQALQNDPNAQKQAQQMQSGGNTTTITDDDIKKLMEQIQQLAASGNREMAAQLLAMLQNMLENMKMTQGGGGGSGSAQGQGNKARDQAMQKLGDMMGKQRALLDKTMRQSQGSGDPKDGGPQGLAKQQGDLQKQLNDAMGAMDPKLKQALQNAQRAMDNAGKALGAKDMNNASNEEKNALQALRQGADQLAAQEKGNGKNSANEDPLGRSGGTNGSGLKLPGADEMARARAILQELRKRAGQRGRPQQELDYIDRLLREF